jgi:hypothetical protein
MPAFRSRRTLLFAGTVGVLATVVVVAAIAIPIYIADDAANKAKACEQEFESVQDGLYAYMANNGLVTVPATSPEGLDQSTGTSDMTTPVPLDNKTTGAANPGNVLFRKTQWMYAWDSTGRINGIFPKPGGPAVPGGCVVSGG